MISVKKNYQFRRCENASVGQNGLNYLTKIFVNHFLIILLTFNMPQHV